MQQLFIKATRWQIVTDKYDVSQLFDKRKSSLKRNDTVQIHFNYSNKLRIFFHTVRFAYHKMKDATKIGCFNERNCWRWVRYSRILTCSSMGINRHTDIKKNRISKTSMESYDNKRWKLLKIHFFINLRKKIIFYELIFMSLSNFGEYCQNFMKITEKSYIFFDE